MEVKRLSFLYALHASFKWVLPLSLKFQCQWAPWYWRHSSGPVFLTEADVSSAGRGHRRALCRRKGDSHWLRLLCGAGGEAKRGRGYPMAPAPAMHPECGHCLHRPAALTRPGTTFKTLPIRKTEHAWPPAIRRSPDSLASQLAHISPWVPLHMAAEYNWSPACTTGFTMQKQVCAANL